MAIANFWLDDNQLQQIAGRIPKTQLGAELFPKWAANYPPPLMTSGTYRGVVVALANVLNRLSYQAATLPAVEQAIMQVDDIIKLPDAMEFGQDFVGAAAIVLGNAWGMSHDHGLSAQQAMAAYDSEMIYVARLFVEARKRELAGERLA